MSLSLGVAAITLAACSTGVAGAPAPALTASPSDSPSRPTALATTTTRSGPPSSDAACPLLTWNDIPADLRGQSAPVPIGSHDPAESECQLDNSVIEINGPAPHELPELPDIESLPDITRMPTLPPLPDVDVGDWKYFIVKVGIGHHISINPANYQGAEDVLIHDYGGVRARGRTSYGASTCVVAFSDDVTKAGVTVVNNRFSHVDMCALAMQLAELVATRLPD